MNTDKTQPPTESAPSSCSADDYFCQWCYDRGLRYPGDGKPWGHAKDCPNAQRETSELGETLQQTHERVCRESWDREQSMRREIEELRNVCRDQAEWIEQLRGQSERTGAKANTYYVASAALCDYFDKAKEQRFPVYAEELAEIIAENTVTETAWRDAFEHLAKMLGVERPNMGHCSAATFDVMKAIEQLKQNSVLNKPSSDLRDG